MRNKIRMIAYDAILIAIIILIAAAYTLTISAPVNM